MGKYYLHKDGILLGTGDCQDGMERHHASPGVSVDLGDPPLSLKPRVFEKTYVQKRREDYPTVGDQLDALWKGLHGEPEAMEAMRLKISAVKEKHPKP